MYKWLHERFTSSGVNFSADFAAVENEIYCTLNNGIETIEKSNKESYLVKQEDSRDWKFLLKFPDSLKSCSKWGLQ